MLNRKKIKLPQPQTASEPAEVWLGLKLLRHKGRLFLLYPSLSLFACTHTPCSHREDHQVRDKIKWSWWKRCARGGIPWPTPTSTVTQTGPLSPHCCPLVEHSVSFLPGCHTLLVDTAFPVGTKWNATLYFFIYLSNFILKGDVGMVESWDANTS